MLSTTHYEVLSPKLKLPRLIKTTIHVQNARHRLQRSTLNLCRKHHSSTALGELTKVSIFHQFESAICNCSGDVGVTRSLDPFSKSPGLETTFTPVTKCQERICRLSAIPGVRNHEVWSQREEGPGSHCSISLLIQWALCA